MKHTPLPWQLVIQLSSYAKHTTVSAAGDPKMAPAIAFMAEANPEADANAALMLAAPELLESLRVMVRIHAHNDTDMTPMDRHRAFHDARSAIAKATTITP